MSLEKRDENEKVMLTGLSEQFPNPSWCPHCRAHFRPLQVCDLLANLDMSRKQLGDVPTLFTTKALVFEDACDVGDAERGRGDEEKGWGTIGLRSL